MSILRRKRLEDGSLGELEKVFEGETEQEKINRLENDNSELLFKAALSEMEQDSMKNDIAELILQVAILQIGGNV